MRNILIRFVDILIDCLVCYPRFNKSVLLDKLFNFKFSLYEQIFD